MSTLQLSLAIIGGLVLALIVAYNTWTSRRNAPKRALPTEYDPAAEPAQRLEPGFDAGATGAMPPSDFHGLDRGPEPSEHTVDAGDALQLPVPPFSSERRPGLDPLIDVIASLQPEHVVSGDAALAALPPTRRAGSKPFAIEGLNEATQQWETPAPGQRYQSFQAGVQLANRMGALNEIEFSEFVVKAQAFADAINAAPDFPDMLQEVARARELDQFASDHDAQLMFMLRARQAAWSPGYVQQNAARLGFVAGAMPGRLV
ncbi:cell division protein FtsZ, partial [Acidovorax soli]